MPIATEIDVVRAWKDETYYEGLSENEKALLPPNPAGKFDPNLDLKSLTKTPTMCTADQATHICTCILQNHTHPCTN